MGPLVKDKIIVAPKNGFTGGPEEKTRNVRRLVTCLLRGAQKKRDMVGAPLKREDKKEEVEEIKRRMDS